MSGACSKPSSRASSTCGPKTIPRCGRRAMTFPARRDGRVLTREIETGLPAGMTALVFNTRRPVFPDPRVREALIFCSTSNGSTSTLYHGLYKRTQSFFERSYLLLCRQARGRARAQNFWRRSPTRCCRRSWRDLSIPVSDGTGHSRENAREAFRLFSEAGYVIEAAGSCTRIRGPPLEFRDSRQGPACSNG